MARYFFDLPNDRDDCGVDFDDMGALRMYALRYCSELMRDTCLGARGKEYWRVDVRNDEGSIVFHVTGELTPVQPGAINRMDHGHTADAQRFGSESGWADRGVANGR
ncbi:MAG: hypothetical protein EOO77_10235 [Oxalobacteraceae bacterium]|nr:MAG: hypothetical protein EOO77_10235 [Oxalobacteraceae bacterium]